MYLRLWLLLVCLAPAAAQKAFIVEGDVVDAQTGAPLPGAQVKLSITTYDAVYTTANEKGQFRFQPSTERFVDVAARMPGYLAAAGRNVELRSGHVGQIHGREPQPSISVSTDPDGTQCVRASFRLSRYAGITGKVTDPEGVPLVGCPVHLLQDKNSDSRLIPMAPGGSNKLGGPTTTQTDDRGEFRFAPLLPGDYYLKLARPGMFTGWESGYQETYFPGTVRLENAKRITLVNGQEKRADFAVVRQRGLRVSGNITVPAAELPPGVYRTATVSLYADGSRTPTLGGGGSHFEFTDVTPGKYTLIALTHEITRDAPVPQRSKYIYGGVRLLDVGEQDVQVDLVVEPLPTLSGTIQFESGCTPSAVRVVAMAFSPPANSAEATSTAEGRFSIGPLALGKYRLSPAPVGYAGPNIFVRSIYSGSRDITHGELDIPNDSREAIRILMGCSPAGGAQ